MKTLASRRCALHCAAKVACRRVHRLTGLADASPNIEAAFMLASVCVALVGLIGPSRTRRVVGAERGRRGGEHLSAFVEEGDVLAYQVGTRLVDVVPLGHGSPPRHRLARAGGVQMFWMHNCEHGDLRGHELCWRGDAAAGPDAGARFEAVLDSDGWPVDCDFGPEQLVARLQEGDELPAQILAKLDWAGDALEPERLAHAVETGVDAELAVAHSPPRSGSPRMRAAAAPQPRLLVSGLSEAEARVVEAAAAEIGWELQAERVIGTEARVALFMGLAGAGGEAWHEPAAGGVSGDDQAARAGGDEAADFDQIAAEACELLLNTVSEALDFSGAEGVVVSACATAPPPTAPSALPSGAQGSALARAVDAAVARHAAEWRLRVPLPEFLPARQGATTWSVTQAARVMHATLDAATVSHAGQSWRDVSEVLVVDGIVDEALRCQLMGVLSAGELGLAGGGGEWDAAASADPRVWVRGGLSDIPSNWGEIPEGGEEEEGGDEYVNAAGGLGLRPEALARLCDEDDPPPAVLELQARLARFLCHANANETGERAGAAADPTAAAATSPAPLCVARMSDACFGGDIPPLAANAPTAADGDGVFGWHIDADPMLLPPSPWTDAYGRYPNRAPDRPRFVTALVYLPPVWEEGWGAPTRFLDTPTGDVLEVPAAPGRVCLMDQDITHAVGAPRPAAGTRPRYSMALKLVVHPPASGSPGGGRRVRMTIPAWGEPVPFGSAAVREEATAGQGQGR